MAEDSTHAYVSRLPCGCPVAVFVDARTRPLDGATFAADEMRKGCAVEWLSVEDARAAIQNAHLPCGHVQP